MRSTYPMNHRAAQMLAAFLKRKWRIIVDIIPVNTEESMVVYDPTPLLWQVREGRFDR
ncbi:MAG: hypothetical protein M0021_09635 [Clostridia bacterium]|nr:hypothetical protein [Clostridia bacterium]